MLKIGHQVVYPGCRPGEAPIVIQVPAELETVPGVPTNQREVDWYAREYPLENINITEGASQEWSNDLRDHNQQMRDIRVEHEKMTRELILRTRASVDLEPTGKPTGEDISQKIKDRARELGFCEVGITAYDFRYDYRSKRDAVKFPHAVCLCYEQDFESTQSIPSLAAEVVHAGTYRAQAGAALALGEYIRSLGYHAQILHSSDSSGPVIPMFVQAGLGQMGACGYLLSPHHGNRMRLLQIITDAMVTYDEPVDYGIHAFCQVCQVCVNRCPGRALMRDKIWWRGIEKNKVYFKRCRPVMAHYMGCGVCMKVCPVQKYGMQTVLDHYAETGQVLGKGSHELEGFSLPDKGYFGPGQMPVFAPSFFSDMPHGTTQEWAMEKLKHQFTENGNQLTDQMLDQFKTELLKAMKKEVEVSDPMQYMKLAGLTDPAQTLTIQEQDYI